MQTGVIKTTLWDQCCYTLADVCQRTWNRAALKWVVSVSILSVWASLCCRGADAYSIYVYLRRCATVQYSNVVCSSDSRETMEAHIVWYKHKHGFISHNSVEQTRIYCWRERNVNRGCIPVETWLHQKRSYINRQLNEHYDFTWMYIKFL